MVTSKKMQFEPDSFSGMDLFKGLMNDNTLQINQNFVCRFHHFHYPIFTRAFSPLVKGDLLP